MDQPRVRFGGVQTPSRYLFELTGGRLCLDFANTLDERPTDHRRERLRDYADLLDWGVQAGALPRREAATLRAQATHRPREAAAALGRARTLRESLFAIFSAIAHGRPAWSWQAAQSRHFDRVLWPVVLSAADLLTSTDLDRVRECEGAGCA